MAFARPGLRKISPGLGPRPSMVISRPLTAVANCPRAAEFCQLSEVCGATGKPS